MKLIIIKIGVLGTGLISGLLATFLFINISLAGDLKTEDAARWLAGTSFDPIPAQQSGMRIAGPPPLTFRSGGSKTYIPLIVKN